MHAKNKRERRSATNAQAEPAHWSPVIELLNEKAPE
jgi:hypothetical protein